MLKKIVQITMLLFAMFTIFGCTFESKDDKIKDDIATYISYNENSSYQKTFEDLNLGIIFDYHLKVNQADQTWVKLWVEAYQDGEKVEDIALPQLSYGESPNGVEEGPVGLGIIEQSSEDVSMFLYTTSGSMSPKLYSDLFRNEEPSGWTWRPTIGAEPVGLELGETKIIGGYRQFEGTSVRTHSFVDPESLQQMIKESQLVLLLKIKVYEYSVKDG